MNTIQKISCAVVLGLISASASANTPSWNYVEGSLVTHSVDDLDSSLSGASGTGVAAINDRFFMSIQMEGISDKINEVDMKMTDIGIGIGLKFSGLTLSQKPTDIFTQLRRTERNWTMRVPGVDAFKQNEDLWVVDAGFRVMVMPEFEAGVMLSHYKYDDTTSERETAAEIKVRYFVSPDVALHAKASASSVVNQFGVGVAYVF